jgi:hypothetical protein
MGIDTMYHAIHAFGLAELLKSGRIDNVDDEHFWNLIDNTYIDDVSIAALGLGVHIDAHRSTKQWSQDEGLCTITTSICHQPIPHHYPPPR